MQRIVEPHYFKKTATRTTILIALGFGLVACGSSNDTPAPVDSTDNQDNGLSTNTDDTTTEDDNNTGTPDTDQTPAPETTVISDNDGICPPAPATGSDTSAIAGLWDDTETGSFGTDVYYFQITNNGSTTGYDYDQDDEGSGNNCYFVEQQTALRATGGNNYVTTNYDTESGGAQQECFLEENEITAVANGDTLTVTYIDRYDDDEDEDTTESITETYERVSGVSATDLTPCM